MKTKIFWSTLTMMMVTVLNVGLFSCSSDGDGDSAVDTTPISLFTDGEKIIQGADTITSSNKFVAYAKGNVVHGYHVGETTLLVNGKKSIPITVLPKYNLYDGPICNWGCSVNYVKSNQKQGTLSGKSTSEAVSYEDAGAASALVYTFKNNKLNGVVTVVSTKYTSQITNFLLERYIMLPFYKGEDTYFIGADALDLDDANVVVMLQVYSASQLVIVYMPASDYSTRSSQDSIFMEEELEEIKEECKKFI